MYSHDRLLELLAEIDDKKIELEEAMEGGELEVILELQLEIDALEREHFRQKMKETD